MTRRMSAVRVRIDGVPGGVSEPHQAAAARRAPVTQIPPRITALPLSLICPLPSLAPHRYRSLDLAVRQRLVPHYWGAHCYERQWLLASIDLVSNDRLFPAQDILPTGKSFGNLIDIPVQRECRQLSKPATSQRRRTQREGRRNCSPLGRLVYPKAVTVLPVGTTRRPFPTAMSETGEEYWPPPPGTPGTDWAQTIFPFLMLTP
jgi:hypothetical protein